MPNQPFGFLNIDKPLNHTSHDVVAQVRRKFGIKKVGHAGTLDPLATGVLIICVGPATRLSEYVMHTTKAYRANVHLGIATTTYDVEGDVTQTTDPRHITLQQLEAVLPHFTGNIDQYPPIYSAIKQDGKKLYELARRGEASSIKRTARHVHIEQITVVDWQPPHVILDVVCGSGTYIRSLAHDIGASLGVGAHLSGLTRTSSGAFQLNQSVTLEAFKSDAEPLRHLIPPNQTILNYPSIILTPQQITEIQHGRWLTDTNEQPDDTLAMAYQENGEFVAVLKAQHGKWRPAKVFSSA